MRYKILILLLILIVTGCAPKPNPNAQIQKAIVETLVAMPTTEAPAIPTPYPSPTPFTLAGLFCEYQFCIGHPDDVPFYDVQAINTNQATPSNYSGGLLAGHNSSFTLFVQVIWQSAPNTSDPQFMLDLILDDVDTRSGNLDVKLIRNMNVAYIPITTTATPVLPFGAAGAWICGERAFAWKVYSPQAESTQALFDAALDRFSCNQ
jgi:hypothetical protein